MLPFGIAASFEIGNRQRPENQGCSLGEVMAYDWVLRPGRPASKLVLSQQAFEDLSLCCAVELSQNPSLEQ
ncbi:MAG: hypothetical protein K0U98_05825 [Deltaproteobacteria bacterium]|nr:hypothetical protein [Deltaproteobacteria bacterium]